MQPSPFARTVKSRAFTLIELLVVIAIIAILAAILFPVFAQAKMAAKKAASISNLKQTGTSLAIYTSDSDDAYPLSAVTNPSNNLLSSNRFIPTPASLIATADASTRAAMEAFVTNSIQPYMKSVDLLRDPISEPVAAGAFSFANGATVPSTAKAISLTYNGLLHAFSTTAVNNPADLTTFWTGQGKRALIGAGYVSPWLNCTPGGACMYQAPSSTCGSSTTGGNSSYTRSGGSGWDMYAGTAVFVYSDGHAKSRKIGVGTTGTRDPRSDPFAEYGGTKNPTKRFFDSQFCHPYLFRPDFDFTTPEAAYAL